MCRCPWPLILAGVLILIWGLAARVWAGEPGFRRRPLDPQRFSASYGYPGTGVDPVPLPGPHPYWGQALGATYYNWGYFGAHRHAQYISHSGYYDNYYQFGYTKGY
jgi:hypothetical protein